MKKINLNGRLSLNKQIVSRLNQLELSVIKGGETGDGCHSAACTDITLNTCQTGSAVTGKHTVVCCENDTNVMICEIRHSETACYPTEV